jgi:hypothetical protein
VANGWENARSCEYLCRMKATECWRHGFAHSVMRMLFLAWEVAVRMRVSGPRSVRGKSRLCLKQRHLPSDPSVRARLQTTSC